MDIFDSDGSVRQDMTTAAEDINRHLEEYAPEPGIPEAPANEQEVVNEAAEPGESADEPDNPWGFIMDWGPF